ncbi:MAG: hypothetical protein HY744_07225 [Deltaproteobacteria bacterium]|nr:hypothetical protein [Deltaproteobacteria bacterium]
MVCLPLPPSGQEAVAPLRAGRERRLATDWPRAALPGPGEPELAIPRLPDRPASWAHYQLPVDPVTGVQPAALRHEGDRPRGARADGIRIGTTPGTPVRVASLAGQQGAAEVLLVGQPDAASVVTAHRVAEPAGLRTYLVLYGELGRLAPDLARGAALAPGVVIGLAGGEAGAGGAVYLEVRLLHPGLAAPQGPLSRAALCAASAACDPRNVLARR